MTETFMHGVDVLEIDAGTRPIRTVRSSVIGVVGTAPDVAPAATAGLQLAPVAYAAQRPGANGNTISIWHRNPSTSDAALGVTVDGNAITVSLATGPDGAVTSTAADVVAAIAASPEASALVAASTADGTAAVKATARRFYLQGGADEAFPLNTPVLIAGKRTEAAKLGARGTLPEVMDDIFDQTGAVVVVVRVAEGATEAETMLNVIGGVDVASGAYLGCHALLSAGSVLGFTPRILIAPGFTHQQPDGAANPVVAELQGIAHRLRAVIVKDGPSTNDAAAIQDRGNWGSKRVYLVDPAVKVYRGEVVERPNSARVAGLIARVDNDMGFWHSPSNQEIFGVVGTARPVDFVLGDSTCRANLLNENEVATIIRHDGFRLWGNRTCSADPKWAFLSVVRTADMINESILQAHMWAVDRNITKTYFEEVAAGVNAYLARLKAQGAILGGECWPDKELNTPESIADGKAVFTFKFTPPFPAENVIFRSMLVNDYIEEII